MKRVAFVLFLLSGQALAEWKLQPSSGNMTHVVVSNSAGDVLGMSCRNKQECMFQMVIDTKCTKDSKIPVTINADSGAYNDTLTCSSGPNSKYGTYLFDSFKELESTLLTSKSIGIALPSADGVGFVAEKFDVRGFAEGRKLMTSSIDGQDVIRL